MSDAVKEQSLDEIHKQIKTQYKIYQALMQQAKTPEEIEKAQSAMMSFVILGKIGVGKTQGIEEIAKELGIGYLNKRLTMIQETDILGIPYLIDGKNGEKITRYSINGEFLPVASRDGENGILVFDEVTSMNENVQSAIWSLFEKQRGMNGYELPRGWMIIACGNDADDGGNMRALSEAIINRGFMYRVRPDINTWLKWASKHGVHPAVVAYIQYKKDKGDSNVLHTFDPDSDQLTPINTPRSWTDLSQNITNYEKAFGKEINNDDFLDYINMTAQGELDPAYAISFVTFYNYRNLIVPVEEIKKNGIKATQLSSIAVKNGETVPGGPEAKYITVTTLAGHYLSEEVKMTEKERNNIIDWLAYNYTHGSADEVTCTIENIFGQDTRGGKDYLIEAAKTNKDIAQLFETYRAIYGVK